MSTQPTSPTQVPAQPEGGQANKLAFGVRPAAPTDGADGAMPAAPRAKIAQQTIVLMVVLSVSAGAIFGMRQLGMKAGIAMGSEVVEYTPPQADHAKSYARIIGDLARIQNPLDVALGEFGKSPFMLQQAAVVAPADPVAAGEDTTAQRAEAERLAKIEERRKQLTEQLAALRVQSILGGKTPLARISGEFYRIGDTIEGMFLVESIEDRTIGLKADGQRFTLTLELMQQGPKSGAAKMGKGPKGSPGKP